MVFAVNMSIYHNVFLLFNKEKKISSDTVILVSNIRMQEIAQKCMWSMKPKVIVRGADQGIFFENGRTVEHIQRFLFCLH